jgi:hypothetical protein
VSIVRVRRERTVWAEVRRAHVRDRVRCSAGRRRPGSLTNRPQWDVAECGKYDARILAYETPSQSVRRSAPLSYGRWAIDGAC